MELYVGGNYSQCDSRMCWLKQGKKPGWLSFYDWYICTAGPVCANYGGQSLGDIGLDYDV